MRPKKPTLAHLKRLRQFRDSADNVYAEVPEGMEPDWDAIRETLRYDERLYIVHLALESLDFPEDEAPFELEEKGTVWITQTWRPLRKERTSLIVLCMRGTKK